MGDPKIDGAQRLYDRAMHQHAQISNLSERELRELREICKDAISEFGATNQDKKADLAGVLDEVEQRLKPPTFKEVIDRAQAALTKPFVRLGKVGSALLVVFGLIAIAYGIRAMIPHPELVHLSHPNEEGPNVDYASLQKEVAGLREQIAKLSHPISGNGGQTAPHIVSPSNTLGIDLWAAGPRLANIAAGMVSFAYFKYGSGLASIDRAFAANAAEAARRKMLWGAYFEVKLNQDPVAQAKAFCSGLKATDFTLPPALATDELGTNASGIAEQSETLRRVAEEVEAELHVHPVIYGTTSYLLSLSDTRLARYPIWVAAYRPQPPSFKSSIWSGWTFWQFSDGEEGANPELNGVDVSLYKGTRESLAGLLQSLKIN
ncbi:MAG TPA: GH25 family lysozyme [Fimbriimonadaceae bacterium]|nr:GH25 family lysozyme [Fimbriimonadaceae bacterium]